MNNEHNNTPKSHKIDRNHIAITVTFLLLLVLLLLLS